MSSTLNEHDRQMLCVAAAWSDDDGWTSITSREVMHAVRNIPEDLLEREWSDEAGEGRCRVTERGYAALGEHMGPQEV